MLDRKRCGVAKYTTFCSLGPVVNLSWSIGRQGKPLVDIIAAVGVQMGAL